MNHKTGLVKQQFQIPGFEKIYQDTLKLEFDCLQECVKRFSLLVYLQLMFFSELTNLLCYKQPQLYNVVRSLFIVYI